jgi:hypothetical protein
MSTDSPALTGSDEDLVRILGTDFQIVACTRVWGAWQAGTMTEDDFINATESDLPAELIAWRDAAVAAERERLAALWGKPVHLRHGTDPGWSVCGHGGDGEHPVMTGDPAKVTCGKCRRSPLYHGWVPEDA